MTEILRNVSISDVRHGDRLICESYWEHKGVQYSEHFEGVAHHKSASGVWTTKEGGKLIPMDMGEGETVLTIHRNHPTLPDDEGTIIVPADGYEYIKAGDSYSTYRTQAATLSYEGYWVGVWRETNGINVYWAITPSSITPGTWKVEES